MKNIVTITATIQVECDNGFCEQLESFPAQEIANKCFLDNTVRVLSAEVIDTEMCDDSLDICKMMDSRHTEIKARRIVPNGQYGTVIS